MLLVTGLPVLSLRSNDMAMLYARTLFLPSLVSEERGVKYREMQCQLPLEAVQQHRQTSKQQQ